MAKPPKSPAPKLTEFASRLSLMKHEADEIGLHGTARAMEHALNIVGYEIADIVAKPH